MIRRTLRFLIMSLAIVGAVTIVYLFLRASNLMKETSPTAVTYALSPSGSHKAVLATWAGGGGISPYCSKRLTVVRTEASTDEAISRDKSVFEAECDSFNSSNNIIRSSPEIKWESDHNLKVTFSIFSTALSPETIKLRKQDASGTIVIDYEVQR
jgi:hypothetical protein